MGTFINMEGRIFGKLLVVNRVIKKGRTNAFWRCKCDCGAYVVVGSNKLIRGQVSCFKCRPPSNIKHLMVGTSEYATWVNMKKRCNNKNDPAYPNYGGRGIKVCSRWDKFINFYTDMGERPSIKHTIDRINNSLGYYKENCRWSTRAEQNRNQQKTIFIELNGVTKCASEWAREVNILPSTVTRRISNGINPIMALTMPSQRQLQKS